MVSWTSPSPTTHRRPNFDGLSLLERAGPSPGAVPSGSRLYTYLAYPYTYLAYPFTYLAYPYTYLAYPYTYLAYPYTYMTYPYTYMA